MSLTWQKGKENVFKSIFFQLLKLITRCLEIERRSSTEEDICSKIDKSVENVKKLVANV